MWIIYRANLDAPGWQNRILLPNGSFTSILAEESWHNGKLPQVGDRVYESRRNKGEVEARDGDWLVAEIEVFTSQKGNQVTVCHCTYSPITPQWEKLERLNPVPASVSTA